MDAYLGRVGRIAHSLHKEFSMQTNFTRLIFAAGAAAAVVGLSACAYGGPGNNAMRAGQESTMHTPQGETGTPHGHGPSTSAPGYQSRATGATSGRSNMSTTDVGQESSNHTSQGETGTPHTH
jgi:hypothetical protein